jgi:hypothetical protein
MRTNGAVIAYDIPDQEVLDYLAGTAYQATYVIRNMLARTGNRPGLATRQVLRKLRRLEREGRVRQVATTYMVMISWALTDREIEARADAKRTHMSDSQATALAMVDGLTRSDVEAERKR